MRVPYAARNVPASAIATLLSLPKVWRVGDIALANVKQIGKNTALELANGRRCTLHERDTLAVVFGNRYATMQFEGYAGANATSCDLLSMGGLCGLVVSKHAKSPEPTQLTLIGAIGNSNGSPLNLRTFRHTNHRRQCSPNVLVVCGTSMDAGKTHSATSSIMGLTKLGVSVAGIKLTGTATGKDTWNMLDAGASIALDFVDGGFPSTYMASLDELLELTDTLIARAAQDGVDWVVIEIADGLLQRETSALLQCPQFVNQVDAFLFAAGDPLAAMGGVNLLRAWGIEPIAISGVVSMSPLGIKETQLATGLPCFKAGEIQSGALNTTLESTSLRDRASPVVTKTLLSVA